MFSERHWPINAEPPHDGHAWHETPQCPTEHWLQRDSSVKALDTHAHEPSPETVSRHVPPLPHGVHAVHEAPKRPGAQALHVAPTHCESHVHEPSSDGAPCVEHVTARENWHAAPACDGSHTHPVPVGVPAPLHVSARVRSHDTPAVSAGHEHAPVPSSPSLQTPPLTHVHAAHVAPNVPCAHKHVGPRKPPSHVHTPVDETLPCALHVTARENSHAAPL
jgi:hypothetical protein